MDEKSGLDRAEAFLQETPEDAAQRARALEVEQLGNQIVDTLKTIYDPEIPVNIYELGLIYKIDIEDDNRVIVTMTLTSPSCPVAESLPIEVENKITALESIPGCTVEITWDPPWHPSMMSEEAQLELGMIY
ncbi:SUF system Fe-S cluster assembly protein [Geminicoccus flavidas]|uniref:SUF system Fe-S cluster assembly protein n=1 Tax=Geminicoccus flavidas TaxID=2506407 RepID=UPI00135855FD|nr:SUF system Fe-S cluster assembly protein [Geminicoccus flavidas]